MAGFDGVLDAAGLGQAVLAVVRDEAAYAGLWPGSEPVSERGIRVEALSVQSDGALHTGECWDPGKRTKPATRAQAIAALRQQASACTKCRPDTALGIEI
ncbi:hypothetical protein BJ965_000060 [Streptomyces luteogriseus]|uniref:Uncharacterized protein n=1 Tax=Streptomyces luteogriseus TaxID=68233 RepID=A0A7W7GFA6_9ACTN|nr:DUF6233 domain-containing protein [Streptomyces luteogriseus]MBB4710178.1 hypothetical protein [Streptomyces luteogriseus]